MNAPHHGFVFWTWLGHFTGVSNESGPGYGFFSGIGSDIGEIALVGGLAAMLHRHNCHETGCLRISRHTVVDPVTGEHVVRCRRHHRQWQAQSST